MAPRRNGQALAVATATVRCAIYTRKSTDEGLDKDFSSLDAQRELAESYATSQRHDGWVTLPDRYDDGGYTGANTKRPALQRLLADVEAGKIDCVVVYRYDRVSRNLLDFLQLMEFLKKHDVAFVSVSERFDTSTPHGEMALNMVLSVAQCERKVIGQRTRDKLGAARRRGKFVGGYPVLAYDCAPEGGRLVVNKPEAEIVREIFRLFLARRSLVATAEELRRRGWTLKRWTTKGGRVSGGTEFNKTNLRRLLTNVTYIGKVNFQGEILTGEHKAIVPAKVFREVEAILDRNCRDRGASHRNKYGSLLRTLLHCSACGTAMIHAPVKRGTRLHRYYRCGNAMRRGATSCPSKAVRADRIEQFVIEQIRRIGVDPELQQATFEQVVSQVRAMKRGLKLELRRLKTDLSTSRTDVQRLVETVSRLTGPASDATAVELAAAQERVTSVEARRTEIKAELAALDTQAIDREQLADALTQFDPIWSVLLTPERERVLQLLIEKIDYDGGTGKLDIAWRLAGFGQLAQEVKS
jgi:site-specific DNA recombinase